MRAKQRPENHLIDQRGSQLLRAKLPEHWVLREYRPDYGLDFAVEVFRSAETVAGTQTYETLGEHFFIQLKSVLDPTIRSLDIFARGNVEKGPEVLDKDKKDAVIDTYPFQLETSELVTVERMGIGVPSARRTRAPPDSLR